MGSLAATLAATLAVLLLVLILAAPLGARRGPPAVRPPPGRRVPLGGAGPSLRRVLARVQCGPGRVPVLGSGHVDAYLTPTSRAPCGRAVIDGPLPATVANLRALELSASAGCGQRAGWFVLDAWGACPGGAEAAGGSRTGGKAEHFFWSEPSARENFVTEHYDQRRRRTRLHHSSFISGAAPCNAEARNAESFSPDRPGTCAQKRSRAAELESEALRVVSGA